MHKRRGSEISDPNAEPDATYVYSRAEDRSVLMRVSYVYDKYKPIIMLAILLVLAIGFDFKTPRTIIREMKDELKATNDRVSQLENVALKMDALIRIKCVELSDKPRDLQLAGIDCTEWMRPIPNNPRTP